MAQSHPGFKGEIKVASRIVDHLSSGIYKSPAACLKELINNAYDADALNVHVSVKPDADRIIVLKEGEVAEQGTHTELIAQKGVYAQMWAQQQEAEQARELLDHIEEEGF